MAAKMRRSTRSRARGRRSLTDEPSSEPREADVLEHLWWPRRESVVTWGSSRFDENLKEITDGRSDAWLEVCLIREEHAPAHLATLEIRTRFVVSEKRHLGCSVIRTIKTLQRKLAERWSIELPEPGTLRSYFVPFDRPDVLRAYGKRSTVALREEAILLLQSLLFVGSMWRTFHQAKQPFSASLVYLLTLNAAEHNDWRGLFRGVEGRGDHRRPTLDFELVIAVGRELGFEVSDSGLVSSRPEVVGNSDEIRERTAGLAARELARRYDRRPATIRRDVINPILRGSVGGALYLLTEKQVRAMRRQVRRVKSRAGETAATKMRRLHRDFAPRAGR
jgi:hypothetical protein